MHEIDWTDEKISRIWNYYAKNPFYQSQYFSYHSGKHIIEYVDKNIKLKNMKTFLDFGCGPGYLIEHLLRFLGNKWGGQIYGLDFSKESIEKFREKFIGFNNVVKAMWVNKLPSLIEDNFIDCVFAVEIIEHLSDTYLSATLNEIYRILKPGGYLIITTPNNEDLEANKTICPECGCIFHRWQHVRSWDKVSLKMLLNQHNFTYVKIKEALIYPDSSRKIIKVLKKIIKVLLMERKNINPNKIVAIVKK